MNGRRTVAATAATTSAEAGEKKQYKNEAHCLFHKLSSL
jgi:hypothetical protein